MQKQIPPKLRWACRRGMLELDVLLGNFLEEAYFALPTVEQAIFVRLLGENDQDLYYWLTGQSVTEDKELALMIGKIRHHAKHRHSY
jgi:antitoxin CptB